MNNNVVTSVKELELFVDRWFESTCVSSLPDTIFSEIKFSTDEEIYHVASVLINKLKHYFETDRDFIYKVCDLIIRMSHACTEDNYKVFSLVLSTMYEYENFKPTVKFTMKEILPNNNCKLEKILPLLKGFSRMYTSISSESEQLNGLIENHKVFVNETLGMFIELIIVDYIIFCDSKLVRKDLLASEKNTFVEGLITKLDELIVFLCEFLKEYCFDDKDFNKEKLVRIFKILTDIFYRKMLNYNPCDTMFHTHFIFGYFLSLHKELSLSFCNFLTKILLNKDETKLNRSRAAINLAGFVSKFNYLSPDVIYRIIDLMFDWCKKYACSVKMISTRYDSHQHFYSIFNSALVIFMFRYSDLIKHRGDGNLVYDSVKWRLDFILNHRLNPLKEFPLKEKFKQLSTLFNQSYMGDMETILSVNNEYYKQPLHISSIPCMYYFLTKSLYLFESLKIQSE